MTVAVGGRRDTTLIFPSSTAEAISYLEEARERGEPVVGASSLEFDDRAARFETWFRLPSVHEPDFAQKLQNALERHSIARIYCSASAVHTVLTRLRAEGRIEVSVVGEMPIARQIREHRLLKEAARRVVRDIAAISDERSTLGEWEVAATLRQALGIFGESDEAKLGAMMAIFATASAGDVVEIGALAGRSASVLAMMAARHGTGATLVVDPWSASDAEQTESSSDLKTLADVWYPQVPFETFLAALMPLVRQGEFNYLAMTSVQAFDQYISDRIVSTSQFGDTSYKGRISVLHIDANHDFDSVRQDCDLWTSMLLPGGWLVLDDYVWLHGDGPRRVGDGLLVASAERIQRAFTCGKALFIQMTGSAVLDKGSEIIELRE